ncbi:MAG: efflux RND transporter periplasmic adaptor subunit [Candidatus Acidiferrum sp.]
MKTKNPATPISDLLLTCVMKAIVIARTQRGSLCSARNGCFLGMLFFAGVLVGGGCGSTGAAKPENGANAPPAGVVRVARKDLTDTLQIDSEFEPFQEVSVYAKVSGYIQKLYVDWGTHVHQGQVLAILEIPELQQQLEVDEAAVQRAQQDLLRAREDLSQAESKYAVTDLTYKRLATVMQTRPGLVAQEEVDVANGKDLEAKAGASGAKAEVSSAEQALVMSKAALEKDKAMFAYARITAPFDGVVTEIDAYGGALLPAGTSSNKGDQALCHLSENDLLRLVIPVPERAVSQIHLGENVAVVVSNNNQTFQGKIARFAGLVDTQTRTMHTEIDVPNPKYLLVPGMYASVRIPLQTAKGVLTVPIQAVQTSGETHGNVFVVNADSRVERREVTLGLQTAADVEIKSGLKENEMVIFGEQSQFKPGELVAPKVIAPAEME